MPLLFLLIAPTAAVFIGLFLCHHIPLTFVLFYGCLFLVPLGQRRPLNSEKYGYALNKNNVLLGAALGVISFGVIVVGGTILYPFLFEADKVRSLLLDWHLDNNYFWVLAAVFTLLNPILEERYWRGYMLQRLGTTRSALWTSSLFYSLYHGVVLFPLFELPYSLLVCLPIFLAGIVWGWMTVKAKSMWGSVICHALADAGIMVLYFQFFL